MKKSKMKRLKKFESAFNNGDNVQVLAPFYDIKQGSKPAYYEWCNVLSVYYIRNVFTRNMWLRIVPKN